MNQILIKYWFLLNQKIENLWNKNAIYSYFDIKSDEIIWQTHGYKNGKLVFWIWYELNQSLNCLRETKKSSGTEDDLINWGVTGMET